MTDWLAIQAVVGVAFLLGLVLGASGALASVAMLSGFGCVLDRAAGAVEALAAQVGALRDAVEAERQARQ